MISLPSRATPEELLSYVRPLYPNGIFPLGAGWVIVFCVSVCSVLAVVVYRNSSKAKRRREAFAEFDCLRRRFAGGKDISGLAADVSVLMRKVALARFGREKTAGLNGRDWTDFLRETGAELSEQDGLLLESQAYAPPSPEGDLRRGRRLLTVARKWLEKNL